MTKLIIVGLLLFLTLFSGREYHPYYVSVVELYQPANDKELEITVKIFTDDFEQILRKNYPNDIIDLYHSKNPERIQILIDDYIQKRFSVKINGQWLPKYYLAHEKSNNATISYFETNYTSEINSVEVVDKLLYDYKKEQTNIIHIRTPKFRKSFKLNQPDTEIKIE